MIVSGINVLLLVGVSFFFFILFLLLLLLFFLYFSRLLSATPRAVTLRQPHRASNTSITIAKILPKQATETCL